MISIEEHAQIFVFCSDFNFGTCLPKVIILMCTEVDFLIFLREFHILCPSNFLLDILGIEPIPKSDNCQQLLSAIRQQFCVLCKAPVNQIP